MGKESDMIILLYPLHDIQWFLKNHTSSASSLIDFIEQINNHYPKDKFLATIPLFEWLPSHLFFLSPILQAPMAFTDGDNKGLCR